MKQIQAARTTALATSMIVGVMFLMALSKSALAVPPDQVVLRNYIFWMEHWRGKEPLTTLNEDIRRFKLSIGQNEGMPRLRHFIDEQRMIEFLEGQPYHELFQEWIDEASDIGTQVHREDAGQLTWQDRVERDRWILDEEDRTRMNSILKGSPDNPVGPLAPEGIPVDEVDNPLAAQGPPTYRTRFLRMQRELRDSSLDLQHPELRMSLTESNKFQSILKKYPQLATRSYAYDVDSVSLRCAHPTQCLNLRNDLAPGDWLISGNHVFSTTDRGAVADAVAQADLDDLSAFTRLAQSPPTQRNIVIIMGHSGRMVRPVEPHPERPGALVKGEVFGAHAEPMAAELPLKSIIVHPRGTVFRVVTMDWIPNAEWLDQRPFTNEPRFRPAHGNIWSGPRRPTVTVRDRNLDAVVWGDPPNLEELQHIRHNLPQPLPMEERVNAIPGRYPYRDYQPPRNMWRVVVLEEMPETDQGLSIPMPANVSIKYLHENANRESLARARWANDDLALGYHEVGRTDGRVMNLRLETGPPDFPCD